MPDAFEEVAPTAAVDAALLLLLLLPSCLRVKALHRMLCCHMVAVGRKTDCRGVGQDTL